MHDGDDDLGILDRTGERPRLTFTRRLPHPPEKVWRAVTEPEHMAAWFPQVMVGEREAGASLRFLMTPDSDDGFDGSMLVFDPPSVMEIMWGTDHLRIEVRPDGEGSVLTLVDTFEPLGKAARDGAGWHECLALLRRELDGAPPPELGSVWRRAHPRYIEALGPDAASIGPPTG